jgi:ABC-type xylose transport system permease subunit
VVGVLTGATVAYIGLPPFIVTLGTYTAIRGAAYLVAGGTTVINTKIGFAWIGKWLYRTGSLAGRYRSFNNSSERVHSSQNDFRSAHLCCRR